MKGRFYLISEDDSRPPRLFGLAGFNSKAEALEAFERAVASRRYIRLRVTEGDGRVIARSRQVPLDDGRRGDRYYREWGF
jgi:hypothetical protein